VDCREQSLPPADGHPQAHTTVHSGLCVASWRAVPPLITPHGSSRRALTSVISLNSQLLSLIVLKSCTVGAGHAREMMFLLENPKLYNRLETYPMVYRGYEPLLHHGVTPGPRSTPPPGSGCRRCRDCSTGDSWRSARSRPSRRASPRSGRPRRCRPRRSARLPGSPVRS